MKRRSVQVAALAVSFLLLLNFQNCSPNSLSVGDINAPVKGKFNVTSTNLSPLVDSQSYDGPIQIKRGGTYSGNWQSNDPDVPVVDVWTDEPVVVENCHLRGSADMIRSWNRGNITVRNCNAYGTTQSDGSRIRKKFLETAHAVRLIVENNYWENMGGLNFYMFEGRGVNDQTIRVLNNVANNASWNFIAFNQSPGIAGVEIAYNQLINKPNHLRAEDSINIYNSSGTPESPMKIHDNYVQGAYPLPAHAAGFTGTGITTDGSGETTNVTSYIEAHHNQFVSTMNAAMNLAGGHHIHFHHNRMITSSRLVDGTVLGGGWAATAVWNNHNHDASLYNNNFITENVIGYRAAGDVRRDFSICPADQCFSNTSVAGDISIDNEKQEWIHWNNKLAGTGRRIGSSVHFNRGTESLNGGDNSSFGAAGVGPAPPALTVLGFEGDVITVASNTVVRYGVAGRSIDKSVTGTFRATNDFFGGDPAPGLRKNIWKVAGDLQPNLGTLPTTALQLKLVASNLCLDIPGASMEDGAAPIFYGCGPQANQRYHFVSVGQGRYQIKSASSGKCLDVPGASGADGVALIQYACGSAQNTNQIFTVELSGNGQKIKSIRAVHSGKCLAPQSDGGPYPLLVQRDCDQQSNQEWTF